MFFEMEYNRELDESTVRDMLESFMYNVHIDGKSEGSGVICYYCWGDLKECWRRPGYEYSRAANVFLENGMLKIYIDDLYWFDDMFSDEIRRLRGE